MEYQEYLDKAEVLIEALPYIRRFNRSIIVIKYGGAAMVDEKLKYHVIEDAVLLKLVGFKPVIVHGGGREISRWSDRVGLETRFENGLRVTDEDTMEVAEMVLAKVNKELVAKIQSLGVRACGISGKDGGLLKVEKKESEGVDLGYVGDIRQVDIKIIRDLLDRDFLPVIFPVGMDDDFKTYNINADEAAGAIAKALKASKLVYLSDVPGVKDESGRVIAEIEAGEAAGLIDSGVISGGMIPKIENCIDAIENGVSRVHILDGRIPHCLLLEFFTNKGIGTAILRGGEEKYYHEQEH